MEMPFLETFAEQRFEQLRKSYQSESIGKATSASKPENVNVSKEFLVILKLSSKIASDCIFGGQNKVKEMEKVIHNVEDRMQKLFQEVTTSTDTNFDDIVALAISYRNVGKTFVSYSETDENVTVGEAHLMKCMKLLNGRELDCKAILPAMAALMELYIAYVTLRQIEKCFPVLDKAMELFSKYTNDEDEYPDPVNIIAILDIDTPGFILFDHKNPQPFKDCEGPKIVLETFHKRALLNLLPCYMDKKSDKHRFVKCVHNMLCKRIADTITSQNTDNLNWADCSIHLSYYFIYNHRLTEARSHIVAAEYMIDIYYKNVLKTAYQMQECTNVAKNLRRWRKNLKFINILCKRYEKSIDNLVECCGIYEITLLRLSRDGLFDRLRQFGDDKLCETNNSRLECDLESQEELTKLLIFSDLEKDLENFNSQLTDKLSVSNINDALRVFKNIKGRFEQSNICFYPNNCLKIITAHKFFVSFEPDKNKQIKLYRKQILEALKIFTDKSGNVCITTPPDISWKILSEVIIAYSSLLDIKTDNLLLTGEQLNEAWRMELLIKIIHIQNLFQIISQND